MMKLTFSRVMVVIVAAACAIPVDAAAQDQKRTTEPVFRVSRNVASEAPSAAPAHHVAATEQMSPLDRAIMIASDGLHHIQSNVKDYTALLIKRERINGQLLEPEYMSIKVRNRRVVDNVEVPFSIYMRFLRPRDVCGREVIWVEGRNNNRLVAHEPRGSIIGLVRANLDPDSAMAMKNNRYPIYEAGIENLVVKLIEKAQREKELGTCEVEFIENVQLNDRTCTMIQVKHPQRRPEYEFHIAQVFIDNELQIPIRYAAYSWPTTPGGKPVLEEEYTYLRVQLNVGLTDRDFDPNNPEYEFP